MTGFLSPAKPKLPAIKKIPLRQDVPTLESELARRAKRRVVAATILSEENILGGRTKLGI